MPDTPSSPIWDRPQPRPRRGATVNRDTIVERAISIADRDGLDGLVMRKLAEELGVGPMTLYRHVPSKEDLIDLMLDEVTGAQDLGALPTGDWVADLRRLADEQRTSFLRHPWQAVPPARPLLGPHGLRRLEIALSSVSAATADPDRQGRAISTLDAFVRGAVSIELAAATTQARTGVSIEDWQRAVAPYMTRMLETGEFPAVEAFVSSRSARDSESLFRDGVDAVLAGLGATFVH